MTYQNVWWYPNYINYHNDVNCTPKRWPNPAAAAAEGHGSLPSFHDKRYYAEPEQQFEERLYFTLLSLGWPQSRQLFEKPPLIPKYLPGSCLKHRPVGFHGKTYHVDVPPGYKYHGPKKDAFYWYERNPYMPDRPDPRLVTTKKMFESYLDVKMRPKQLELFTDGPDTTICGCCGGLPAIARVNSRDSRFVRLDEKDSIKRQTADGVGFM